MTRYAKLMRKARRKNYMHADAAAVGHLLGQCDGSIFDKGLKYVLFGPELGNFKGEGIDTVLWNAIHQENWDLVAEALDTMQTLRRAYHDAMFDRKCRNQLPVFPPIASAGRYLQ